MTVTKVERVPQSSVGDILKYQLECVRTGQFEYLGKIKCIVLEAAAGANLPAAAVTNRVGLRLDFYNEGPALAQTLDRSQLLFVSPIVRADGRAGLPDIPDPDWKPPIFTPTQAMIEGKEAYPAAPVAPMIPQRLEERATGLLKGTNFLVFEPVAQVLIHPEGIADYWLIEGRAHQGTGTHLALIVDRVTGQAHFYGGMFRILGH